MANTAKPKSGFFCARNMVIIMTGLVVILAGVASGLWYWTASPQYALRQLRNAAEDHDWEQFEKHIDIDGFTASAAAQLVEYSLNNSCREKSGDFIAELMHIPSSDLSQNMKNQLRDYIKTGSPEKILAGSVESTALPNLDLLLRKLTGNNTAEVNKVEYVKTDGQQATVGMIIYYPKLKADLILELSLKNQDGHWKLTGIPNISEYLSRLSKVETTKLDKLNRPVSVKINGLLSVSTVSTAKIFSDANGSSESLSFRFNIKNNANQIIKQLDGEILVFDRRTGQLMLDWTVRSGEITIMPEMTEPLSWARAFSRTLPGDRALIEVPYGDLITKFKVERVIFADGSKLEATTTF